jgi:hypothetical protein
MTQDPFAFRTSIKIESNFWPKIGSRRVSRPRQRLDTMSSGEIEHDVHREASIRKRFVPERMIERML